MCAMLLRHMLAHATIAAMECSSGVSPATIACRWCNRVGTREDGFRRGFCPRCRDKAPLPPERLPARSREASIAALAARVAGLPEDARHVVLDALRVPREWRGMARRAVAEVVDGGTP